MTFLTDFADQAVVLPLALAVGLLLAASGWRRGCLGWLFSVGLTLGVLGVSKLVFAACGPLRIGDVLASPSGHTASAAMIYGGLLGLTWRCLRPGQRHIPVIASLAIAVPIGITRIALHAHSWAEVIAGGTVGVAGVWLLLGLAGPAPLRLRPWRFAILATVIVLPLHGAHLRAEPEILDWGQRLAWILPGCADQARP